MDFDEALPRNRGQVERRLAIYKRILNGNNDHLHGRVEQRPDALAKRSSKQQRVTDAE